LPAKITCDPAKREATLKERGIDFLDAASVLDGRTYTIEDRRKDYGELRSDGRILDGRMVMVVWTPRGETVHVISMRKCNDREQKAHRQRLGED
jgi:uncharacterized DUF497 family protein